MIHKFKQALSDKNIKFMSTIYLNLLNLELCIRRLLINTMAGVLSFYVFMTSDDDNVALKLIILIISSILFFLLIRKFRYNSNK